MSAPSTEFLYLSQEDVVAAGGTDMAAMIDVMARAFAVKAAGRLRVPLLLVFLWPVAESARRSLSGPLQVLSDTEGRFRFDSLPPGDYRLLASFDVYEIDEEVIELSGAVVVHAEASQTVTIEAPVWIAP